ncbi:MAG: glutamine transporter permease protein [Actinomycetia bacterium]|nr:glutamine transporter permease protein [Actinomycetes bacterium]
MFLIALRDLQWRRRRFLIGVIATGLVFALALLITGMGASFSNEVRRTVRFMGADAWVVPRSSSGPFTAASAFPASVANDVAKEPGVKAASALAVLHFTVRAPSLRDINVIGVTIGGVGAPHPDRGRTLRTPGELVANSSLGRHIGDALVIGGKSFKVVGTTHGISFLGGTPAVFISLADAQAIALGDQRLATSIVTSGVPQRLPAGMRTMTNAAVISDLSRPLKHATQTITFLCVLLWIVAAGIIGSVVYLQALERVRDFAVLKATGTTNGALLAGLAFQSVLLSLAAAVAAVVLSTLLAPLLAMPAEISAGAYALLPLVAVIVGLLASLFGLRRAVGVDPALAFGSA